MAGETPYEITLTMNAVSQIVDSVSPPFEDVAVMAPSSQLENVLGYDAHVSHPFLKFAGLQFKRPYRMADPTVLNFKLNTEQLATLHELSAVLLGRKAVFYALPPIKEYSAVSQTLSRTVFVDVEGVQPDTSGIRVPEQQCQSHPSKGSLAAWEKHNGLYEIDAEHVYCWWEFVQGLVYPMLDIPVEYIREWNLSRRTPLVDPDNPDSWVQFTEDIPGYAFEDPEYEKQVGVPLRAPCVDDRGGLTEESLIDSTEQIASRANRAELRDGELASMAGAIAGGNPSQYR